MNEAEELSELRLELIQRRRDLYRSERAEVEGRVVDRGRWLASLARQHTHIATLEQEEARLVARLDAETEAQWEELGERLRVEEREG